MCVHVTGIKPVKAAILFTGAVWNMKELLKKVFLYLVGVMVSVGRFQLADKCCVLRVFSLPPDADSILHHSITHNHELLPTLSPP